MTPDRPDQLFLAPWMTNSERETFAGAYRRWHDCAMLLQDAARRSLGRRRRKVLEKDCADASAFLSNVTTAMLARAERGRWSPAAAVPDKVREAISAYARRLDANKTDRL